MVRNLSILVLLLITLNSCFSYKTKYGKKRFKYNKFTIKFNTNNNAYNIIDTSKIYKIISSEEINYKKKLEIVTPTYLKFYANGRLGIFQNYDKNNIKSLDPKKSRMAIYNYTGDELIIQIYFNHPQGGGLVKSKLFRLEEDTLELKSENYLEKYKKLSLPKDFLIYKPDW
ncbi:MAG: hypothetical protein L3J20_09995 [Flavobacteriaceae bacterium]|nr:hypothetical protein [Flavobacteriaceae bacterium]